MKPSTSQVSASTSHSSLGERRRLRRNPPTGWLRPSLSLLFPPPPTPGPKISRELAGRSRELRPWASSAALAVFARDCFLPPSPASPPAFLPSFPVWPPPPSPAGPLPAGIIWSPAMDSPSAGQFMAAALPLAACAAVRRGPSSALLTVRRGVSPALRLGCSPFRAEAAKARPPRSLPALPRGGNSAPGREPLLDIGSLQASGNKS